MSATRVLYAGGPGAPFMVQTPFAFDTPGIEDGIPCYTPQLGDVLLDVFAVITEPFDGTTPLLDFGAPAARGGPGNAGFLADWATVDGGTDPVNGALDVSSVDVSLYPEYAYLNALPRQTASAVAAMAAYTAVQTTVDHADPVGRTGVSLANLYGTLLAHGTNPWAVWVSQDGLIGGAPVGGAIGAGYVTVLGLRPLAPVSLP